MEYLNAIIKQKHENKDIKQDPLRTDVIVKQNSGQNKNTRVLSCLVKDSGGII